MTNDSQSIITPRAAQLQATPRAPWSRLVDAYLRVTPAVRHGVVISVAFALLLGRRPSMLTRAEFFNEDGQIFFLGTYFGSPVESVLRPYQGYLHVVPRLLALIERMVPIALAPLVANAAALLIVAALAAYLAGGRMADLMPSQAGRWLMAIMLVTVPGSFESLGSATYIQWYLAVYLVMAAMARPPASRLESAGDSVTLVLASLTGPFGFLVAPLYGLRAALDRSRTAVWRGSCVVVPGLLQLAVVATSPRAASIVWTNPQDSLSVIGLRAVLVPLLGTAEISHLTADGFSVVLAGLGALVAAGGLIFVLFRLPHRRLSLALGYGYFVLLGASLKGSTDGVDALYSVWSAQRYFLIPGIMIALLVAGGLVSLTSWRRLVAAGLLLALFVGVTHDYLLPPRPNLDWPATSVCIGGSQPCVVPVYPPTVWSIRWPGENGDYEQSHQSP